MRFRVFSLLFIVVSAAVVLSGASAEEKEVRKGQFNVDMANGSYYACYVPENYEPDGKTGAFLLMHGSGGKGENIIGTFMQILKDRNCIGVAPKSSGIMWEPGDKWAMEAFKDMLSKYKVDEKRMHIVGYSAGGLFAGWLAFSDISKWKTIVIVAASASNGNIGAIKKDKNKPVYLINGENCRFASDAISNYKTLIKMGARYARLKILPGEGHNISTAKVTPTLMRWYRAMESGYDYVTALEKARKYSKKKLEKAMALIREIEAHPEEDEIWKQKDEIREVIDIKAAKKLKALLSRLKRKPEELVKKLKEFEKLYEGYDVAEKAAAERRKLTGEVDDEEEDESEEDQ